MSKVEITHAVLSTPVLFTVSLQVFIVYNVVSARKSGLTCKSEKNKCIDLKYTFLSKISYHSVFLINV